MDRLSPIVALLKDFRVREGLTQAALAAQLGVNQATVSRWQSGASEPTIGQRRRITDLVRKSAGLSISTQAILSARLDPNPCSIATTRDFVWNLANDAAIANHHPSAKALLGAPVRRTLCEMRQTMIARGLKNILKGEIVGARSVRRDRTIVDPSRPFDAGNYVENGRFNESNMMFSIQDGQLITIMRDRYMTRDEFQASGLQIGYRFLTLDEALST